MDWSLVNLKDRYIEVPGGISKTGVRRIVPISDNMAVWLTKYSQPKGPMVPFTNLGNQFLKVAKKAGVQWKRNCLRHSFISYRVALTKNVHQTSVEAGNSSSIIMQCYFRAVTDDQAQTWFSILPDAPTNITEVPFQSDEQAKQIN
jgi:integrase